MKKFVIRYTRIPTNYNTPHNALVEAETPELASQLLHHRLGDFNGVREHVYGEPVEYVPPPSAGRVLSYDHENSY